jgi:hypothetical protein
LKIAASPKPRITATTFAPELSFMTSFMMILYYNQLFVYTPVFYIYSKMFLLPISHRVRPGLHPPCFLLISPSFLWWRSSTRLSTKVAPFLNNVGIVLFACGALLFGTIIGHLKILHTI